MLVACIDGGRIRGKGGHVNLLHSKWVSEQCVLNLSWAKNALLEDTEEHLILFQFLNAWIPPTMVRLEKGHFDFFVSISGKKKDFRDTVSIQSQTYAKNTAMYNAVDI